MNRKRLKIITRIAATIVLLVIATILWSSWLSYYWHTDELHLYQSKGSFRLCDGLEQLMPSWTPNEEYYAHISKAEQAIAEGKSLSIFARGVVSDTGSDVYVDKIIEVVVGTDAKCEQND